MLNKKIKYSIDILILSFILINPVNAEQPNLEINWELEGLHNPESAVYDPVLNHLYVSNVDGSPIDKDRNGFISIVSLDGKIINKKCYNLIKNRNFPLTFQIPCQFCMLGTKSQN